MMANNKARSRSDRELAEWGTRESGIAVSPWQIERWRQAGLLQPAEHVYPGRGSKATYGDQPRRQVVELAQLSKHYRNYDDLARVLFMRAGHVREESSDARYSV